MKKIVILGPAWPLRGGLAAFDERLAEELQRQGHQVRILSFSLQYPSILFPGKSQKSDQPAPKELRIESGVNSVWPLNWIVQGLRLKKEKPDILAIRYWIPFMAPALGTIARMCRTNHHTRIIGILDNVLPHERRPGDVQLTRWFSDSCHAFVAMTDKVRKDINAFGPQTCMVSPHPLYDRYGPLLNSEVARRQLKLREDCPTLLFFGFIRAYKGLDILLQALAMDTLRNRDFQLMVAGEFYEKPEPYYQMVREAGLSEKVHFYPDYIPDEQVNLYFSAADIVVQPYRSATQSGITQAAFSFRKPMIATRVGGLPEMIREGETGWLCEPEPESLAQTIAFFLDRGTKAFEPHLNRIHEEYSWSKYASTLLNAAETNR